MRTGAGRAMSLVVADAALEVILQVQSESRLWWSQVQWGMVAGMGRLFFRVSGFGGWGWCMGCSSVAQVLESRALQLGTQTLPLQGQSGPVLWWSEIWWGRGCGHREVVPRSLGHNWMDVGHGDVPLG